MALLSITVVLYLALAIVGARLALTCRDRLLYLPVSLAALNEAVWHLIPAVALFLRAAGTSDSVSDDVRMTAVGSAMDFAYIVFWIGSFMMIARMGEVRHARMHPRLDGSDPGGGIFPMEGVDRRYFLSRLRPILWFCIACVILQYPLAQLLDWPSTYAEQIGVPSRRQPRLVPLFILVSKGVQLTAPVACLWIMLVGGRVMSPRNLFALCSLGLGVLAALAVGVRGYAASPVVLLVLTAYCLRRRVAHLMLVALGFVVLLILVSPAIRAVRTTKDFARQTSILSRIGFVLEEWGARSGTDQMSDVFYEGAVRMNKGHTTGYIHENTKITGYVWHKPYRGMPFVLVPRAVWPNKPVFGSRDNTTVGVLALLAGYWLTGNETLSLTPGPAAQPYWVAGRVGIPVIAILGGLIIGYFWSYLRLCHRPIPLLVLLTVMSQGVSFDLIYYDVSWPYQAAVQKGAIIFFLWILSAPFGTRTRGLEA